MAAEAGLRVAFFVFAFSLCRATFQHDDGTASFFIAIGSAIFIYPILKKWAN